MPQCIRVSWVRGVVVVEVRSSPSCSPLTPCTVRAHGTRLSGCHTARQDGLPLDHPVGGLSGAVMSWQYGIMMGMCIAEQSSS